VLHLWIFDPFVFLLVIDLKKKDTIFNFWLYNTVGEQKIEGCNGIVASYEYTVF
jgi:hypothetical protein